MVILVMRNPSNHLIKFRRGDPNASGRASARTGMPRTTGRDKPVPYDPCPLHVRARVGIYLERTPKRSYTTLAPPWLDSLGCGE